MGHNHMPSGLHRVWIVACPGVELLDVAGPFEVLQHANDLARRPIYAVQIVSPEGGAVSTRHGVILGATRSLADAAEHHFPNTLIVAGAAPTDPLP
jgi:transcriptional regulator GlxA family with amidase domain